MTIRHRDPTTNRPEVYPLPESTTDELPDEPDAYDLALARKIIDIRREAGLTQKDLGELIGVAQAQINRWEAAKGQPRPGQLLRLVQVVKYRLPWLTADCLIDPEAIQRPSPTSDAYSPEEQFLFLLIRDLGPDEARRRLIGVGLVHHQERDRSPQVVKPIRSITRRAENLQSPETKPELAPETQIRRGRGRPRSKPATTSTGE